MKLYDPKQEYQYENSEIDFSKIKTIKNLIYFAIGDALGNREYGIKFEMKASIFLSKYIHVIVYLIYNLIITIYIYLLNIILI